MTSLGNRKFNGTFAQYTPMTLHTELIVCLLNVLLHKDLSIFSLIFCALCKKLQFSFTTFHFNLQYYQASKMFFISFILNTL